MAAPSSPAAAPIRRNRTTATPPPMRATIPTGTTVSAMVIPSRAKYCTIAGV